MEPFTPSSKNNTNPPRGNFLYFKKQKPPKNSGIHINNICKATSAKIKGLGRTTNRLNLSQAKILYYSFILSQFNYCCLVWMFSSKTLPNKINQIHKRGLSIVYNEQNLNLDNPVELDKSTTIHIKNIITMLTEVYKTTSGENPIFMNEIFTQKKQYYNLRITNLLSFPKVIGSKYGTNTFVFRATHLWNQVPDSIKNEPNAKCFKAKLTRNWQVIKCTCTSCKYVEIVEVIINPLPCNFCILYRN